MKKGGFTLIELLTVVSIIGILSAVIITSLNQARVKAKEAETRIALSQMRTIVASAQIASSKTVLEMTGDANTLSSCPGSTDLSSLAVTHACVVDWRNAIDAIGSDYDLGSFDSSNFYTDSWGSPYLLDENEGEIIGDPCHVDTITSVGDDRTIGGGDDISIILTFEHCS